MGNSNGSYLGSVGRGGTSNQANASFQIGRARRSFQSQQAENTRRAMAQNQMSRGAGTGAYWPFAMMANAGIQKSLDALRDWQDTPYGPALTREAAVGRLGGNRLMGNRAQPTLLDRADLRPSNSQMTAQQARTGGDRYIQMRFNEPNYRSR